MSDQARAYVVVLHEIYHVSPHGSLNVLCKGELMDRGEAEALGFVPCRNGCFTEDGAPKSNVFQWGSWSPPAPDNAVAAYWRSDGTLWRCSDVERDLWQVAVWVDGNEGMGMFHDRVVNRSEMLPEKSL